MNNNKSNKKTKSEIERIERIYKDTDEVKEFIIELFMENGNSKRVSISKYKQICSENMNIVLDPDDFLKFLILKNYVRKGEDINYTDMSRSFWDENLNLYVECLYERKELYIKLYKYDIPIYLLNKVGKLNNENIKLSGKMQNYTKDIITIMGLFVSVIAILISNSVSLKNLDVWGIVIMNLSLILSISIIFLFINNIIGREECVKRNNEIGLSIIAILFVSILCILFLKYSNFNIFLLRLFN